MLGWGIGIRTPIAGTKTQSPTVRRSPIKLFNYNIGTKKEGQIYHFWPLKDYFLLNSEISFSICSLRLARLKLSAIKRAI